MRFNGRLWRLLALFFGFTMIVAACGDDSGGDDDAPVSDTTEDTATDTTAARLAVRADGVLTVGDAAAARRATSPSSGHPSSRVPSWPIKEINDAGGVLGADVEYSPGDSGDTNTDIANQTTDRHLADGVDAIVGAASSGVSFTVIDKITGANVIQFSPANTSPDFTDYDDNGLYFRTAPSDVLQGRVLSDLIVADGNATVGDHGSPGSLR